MTLLRNIFILVLFLGGLAALIYKKYLQMSQQRKETIRSILNLLKALVNEYKAGLANT